MEDDHESRLAIRHHALRRMSMPPVFQVPLNRLAELCFPFQYNNVSRPGDCL